MKSLTAIILAATLALTSGCVRPEESNFQSTVEVLPKNINGTWIVKCGECEERNLVTVTPKTRIEGEDTARVGDLVDITGRVDGSYLVASKITVRPAASEKKRVPRR